jgi:hypothetical protein
VVKAVAVMVVVLMLPVELLLELDTTELLALPILAVAVAADLVVHLKVTVLLVDQALLLFVIIQQRQ